MTTSNAYPDDTYDQHTPLALIWGNDDPVEPVYHESIARVMPPKQVSNPVYISIHDLESIREIEQAQRRERVQLYQSQGW